VYTDFGQESQATTTPHLTRNAPAAFKLTQLAESPLSVSTTTVLSFPQHGHGVESCDARLAGSHAASTPTAISTAAVPEYVFGSGASTRKSRGAMDVAAHQLPARQSAIHTTTSTPTRRKIRRPIPSAGRREPCAVRFPCDARSPPAPRYRRANPAEERERAEESGHRNEPFLRRRGADDLIESLGCEPHRRISLRQRRSDIALDQCASRWANGTCIVGSMPSRGVV
jgi:hypothetical protein